MENKEARKKNAVYSQAIYKCPILFNFYSQKRKISRIPMSNTRHVFNRMPTTCLRKTIDFVLVVVGHPSVLKVSKQISSFGVKLITCK